MSEMIAARRKASKRKDVYAEVTERIPTGWLIALRYARTLGSRRSKV